VSARAGGFGEAVLCPPAPNPAGSQPPYGTAVAKRSSAVLTAVLACREPRRQQRYRGGKAASAWFWLQLGGAEQRGCNGEAEKR